MQVILTAVGPDNRGLADPKIKAAINEANFELLVGFQLSDDQLKYNATR